MKNLEFYAYSLILANDMDGIHVITVVSDAEAIDIIRQMPKEYLTKAISEIENNQKNN